MKSLILGAGEIGSAYYSILNEHYSVWRLDIRPELRDDPLPDQADILHVCLRYNDGWESAVHDAIDQFRPELINIMTTTPPGTTAKLGPRAVHSTTRGLHPALSDFIKATPKHIGGPAADRVAAYFIGAGIECITHAKAVTTELLHIASNTQYAASIVFAAEIEKLFREYGVDWFDFERYSFTHNQGYAKMGYSSKFRPILHPPGPTINGHCLTQNSLLIPEEKRGPIMRMIAGYNE